METKKLMQQIKAIKMPQKMQQRIIDNCYKEMEITMMKHTYNGEMCVEKNKTLFMRPMAAAASLILCFCLAGVTGLAASGKLQGFFRNIVRWDGAVTGTTYEQATDEIHMQITDVADTLTVEFTILDPTVAPYAYIDTFGIKEYTIVNADGKVVAGNDVSPDKAVKDQSLDMAKLSNGNATVTIPLTSVPAGEYTLIITKLVSSAKADQPLEISGVWECTFIR
ncbi:MAG: hypothetical protein IJ794_14820 [Lachnospiraceae bacterium]|nr:hypothetical protein [Lachnospiraceae bacterium]